MRRLLSVFWVGLLALSAVAFAQSSERWVVFRSEHLLMAMRADLPLEFYLEGDSLDASLGAFNDQLQGLEAQFLLVEHMLQADYRADSLGRVPVLIYPDLESYQRAANCLICAAHVGRPVDQPVNNSEALLSFGAHLNLESTTSTILHEFVHIVDFVAVYAGAHAMWFEGMASYIGNKLLGERGQPLIDVLPQYLRLYQNRHPLGLRDYLIRPGYGRWTYNLGTNLINLLVERDGWDTYMQFYRALRRPDFGDYDRLFQQFYGLTLDEVEALWQAQLNNTEITDNGQKAFQFKMDQIVVRWIYLRPLLKDPQRMSQAYASLWSGSGFNVVESELMRDFLGDFANMNASKNVVPLLLAQAEQLRGYANTFYEDNARVRQLNRALDQLNQSCAGAHAACALNYFNLIHDFVRW